MKNVLVIYYTQSGQLAEIAQNVAKPFLDSERYHVDFHEVKPVTPFPFPWDSDQFFGVFPESFAQEPITLQPVPTEFLERNYDLILFHYQVWYLSPSIPMNSFLKSDDGKSILKGKPVVTVSGSRNMWVMAQEKVKVLLDEAGANLVGNVALVDRVGNLISVLTIVEWMFSGKKAKKWGILPLPGVSEADILDSSKFGRLVKGHLESGDLQNLQPELVENDAVRISPYLVLVDRTGNKIFNKWSKFIKSRKSGRKTWLKVFYVYLFLAIWVISPIVYILHLLTYPLKINKIKRETLYFQGVQRVET
ncbi:dialkylrecorsinol condensing enzyme DarA [Flavobacterium selenitireducens]|uniref:dialkylrecorsinol condensing enzyme DarA n=1 Tax=Flavobacterium selenitireducens TaxID=2722704 RepID=UPI00168AFA48|nr:dialkylrecorsinol condensing enzyme DarA [Flavobacterium selenitireducens]MBD3582159.1 dialkylresorcinol condensing enzyme DarA [Flavobacterium selenitireducens]